MLCFNWNSTKTVQLWIKRVKNRDSRRPKGGVQEVGYSTGLQHMKTLEHITKVEEMPYSPQNPNHLALSNISVY